MLLEPVFLNPRAFTSRILGIDNGSSLVGLSINDHDIRTGESEIIWQTNFNATKIVEERFPGRIYFRDEFQARLCVIEEFVTEVLEEWDPDVVGCESPFSHLHAHAFAALVQSMSVIDNAVYQYRRNLPFIKVPPGKGKKAACPPGQYKDDKEWIHHCLANDPRIRWAEDIDPKLMGPDALDSVAVGRYIASLENLD